MIGRLSLGIGLIELRIGLIELGIGLIEQGIGLIEPVIGLMELGIGPRINNARRTVLFPFEEEMRFIGRTKRTIWMGAPSLCRGGRS